MEAIGNFFVNTWNSIAKFFVRLWNWWMDILPFPEEFSLMISIIFGIIIFLAIFRYILTRQ